MTLSTPAAHRAVERALKPLVALERRLIAPEAPARRALRAVRRGPPRPKPPRQGDLQPSLSASTATASATSARSTSDGASTNSSGVWAPPPRGPSPSIVSGIVEAKWLASLAPPRPTPAIGRPRRSEARSSSPAVWPDRVHPRPPALHPRLERHAADLRRDRGEHRRRTPRAGRRACRARGRRLPERRSAPRRSGSASARRSADRSRPGRDARRAAAPLARAPAARCGPDRERCPNGRPARRQRAAACPRPCDGRRRPPRRRRVRSPASKHRQAS